MIVITGFMLNLNHIHTIIDSIIMHYHHPASMPRPRRDSGAEPDDEGLAWCCPVLEKDWENHGRNM